jgi:hypothetical protein
MIRKAIHQTLFNCLNENKLSFTHAINEQNENKRKARLITEVDSVLNGKTIINTDIQPEYEKYISFNLREWVSFINKNSESNKIVFLYNGENTLGMISEGDYKEWLFELGIDEEVIYNSTFYDKGYAFFRYCIDKNINEDAIVLLIKFMIKNNINDSRDMNWKGFVKEYKEEFRDDATGMWELKELLEGASDMISIPDLMDFLERYSNIVLTGGGINQCLKEVEIALLSLDKKYNTLSKFTY